MVVGLADTISLAELVYLIEKRRIEAQAYHDLRRVLSDPGHVFVDIPFTIEIAEAMRSVPRASIPDLPDRMDSCNLRASERSPHKP